MLSFFLTIAMLVTPQGFTFKDVQFTFAVEQFAQKNAKGLPIYWREKFSQLEGPEYSKRRTAYQLILFHCAESPSEARFLFWGLAQPDMEVRLWCNKALWRLSECPICKGTGIHDFESDGFYEDNTPSLQCKCERWHPREQILCPKCGGAKRFWFKGVAGQP